MSPPQNKEKSSQVELSVNEMQESSAYLHILIYYIYHSNLIWISCLLCNMNSGFSKTFYRSRLSSEHQLSFCETSEEKAKPIPKVWNEIILKIKLVPKFPRTDVVQKLPQALWCAHFITFSKSLVLLSLHQHTLKCRQVSFENECVMCIKH